MTAGSTESQLTEAIEALDKFLKSFIDNTLPSREDIFNDHSQNAFWKYASMKNTVKYDLVYELDRKISRQEISTDSKELFQRLGDHINENVIHLSWKDDLTLSGAVGYGVFIPPMPFIPNRYKSYHTRGNIILNAQYEENMSMCPTLIHELGHVFTMITNPSFESGLHTIEHEWVAEVFTTYFASKFGLPLHVCYFHDLRRQMYGDFLDEEGEKGMVKLLPIVHDAIKLFTKECPSFVNG